MALLERYLDAVRRHLPAAQEDDIVEELRDDIQAAIDERAAALGRPLTEDDEAEIIKPYGRPIVLASRYRKQSHLIGPEWFPFYWDTLKIVVAIGLIINVAVVVLMAIAGRPTGRAIQRLFQYPTGAALSLFAWVTLLFASLEFFGARRASKDWDPRKLPKAGARPDRPSRIGLAIELVFDAVFLAWWTSVQRSADLLFLPPAVAPGPQWPAFYLPVLGLVLASMVVKSVATVRPDWAGFRLAAGVVVVAVGIAVASFVLNAGPLLVPVGPAGNNLARVLDGLLRWAIGIGVFITFVTTTVDVWRFFRSSTRAARS